MPPSSNELRYFIELAKTLHFSRTAERIGISQPSLSAAIKKLELALGVALFIRSKHQVTLTQAGKKFLLHAQELQQLWESTKSVCIASHHEVQGNIILGCHPSVAIYALPEFLPQLLKKYPKLELQLQHDMSRKVAEQVISLRVDIGIVVNPVKHPHLVIKKLFEDEFACWVSDKKSAIDLEKEVTIIADPGLLQTQSILKKLYKTGIKNYRMISSSSLEVIAQLAASGIGIGILPGRVVESTVPGQLKKFAKTPVYRDEICLIYRHENRNVQAIQVVSEAIKTLLVAK